MKESFVTEIGEYKCNVRRIYRSLEEQQQDEGVTDHQSYNSPWAVTMCAYHIEHAMSETDLLALENLRSRIPLDLSRPTCPRRFISEKHVYCNSGAVTSDDASTKSMHKEDGWVGRLIDANLERWNLLGSKGKHFQSLPWFRFLEYSKGGNMAIHSDGSNVHPGTGERSVATMMIYLSTCDKGGETTLYHKVKTDGNPSSKYHLVPLEHIAPTRNTVLIFPHSWQHSGDPINSESTQKIALRIDLCLAPPRSMADTIIV